MSVLLFSQTISSHRVLYYRRIKTTILNKAPVSAPRGQMRRITCSAQVTYTAQPHRVNVRTHTHTHTHTRIQTLPVHAYKHTCTHTDPPKGQKSFGVLFLFWHFLQKSPAHFQPTNRISSTRYLMKKNYLNTALRFNNCAPYSRLVPHSSSQKACHTNSHTALTTRPPQQRAQDTHAQRHKH